MGRARTGPGIAIQCVEYRIDRDSPLVGGGHCLTSRVVVDCTRSLPLPGVSPGVQRRERLLA
jgi:hypothetical protein